LKRLIILGLVVTLVIVMSAPAALLATGGGNGGHGKKKVTICHKGKTIKVSKNAVKAHKKHGDKIGKPCRKDNGKFHKCDTDRNGIVTPSEKEYCKKDDNGKNDNGKKHKGDDRNGKKHKGGDRNGGHHKGDDRR
jgi:hypothetical protein